MSGPANTEWTKYLNGGSSKYNFSYHEANINEIAPSVESMPITKNIKLDPISNDKSNVSKLVKNMKGGKQKTRRHTKKYRYSHRK